MLRAARESQMINETERQGGPAHLHQTSVPRTEYEISLQLSVACQEDPSSLT